VGERTEGGATGALDAELGSRHPLRILVAEDNVVNQKLALRILEKLGYRADIAANGLEVLEALERQPYDLLLSDVQMPEMDGLEATRRILERWSEGERPWIVAMTAEAMQGDRERCLEAGMDDYLTKPIRVEELVAAIERTPDRGGAAAVSAAPSGDALAALDGSVDPAVLQRLIQSMGGDEAFVAEIIDEFLSDSLGLVASARAALETEDAAEVRRAAHTLKSNAATFGAHGLAERSRALEEASKDGVLVDGDELLASIAEELEVVRQELRAARARLAGA
jgi:CheY-like chemotaxis protein